MIGERMGTNQPYLKAQNTWLLRLFIGVNVAVFLSIAIGQQLTAASIDHFWQPLSTKNGLLAVCFALATIVLNGVLGDLAKARVVFWRWRNPLPGCRAFSVIMLADPRIDVARLRFRLSPIPSDPKEQNAAWYHLYKAHADKQTISEAHRAYLLTRDMAALALLFAVAFSTGAFITAIGWKLATLYSVALVAQYTLIATSARNYGNRFVANVLAEESHA
jgi:hypothetical protein